MTKNENLTHKELHPQFEIENCMEMMAQMMTETIKHKESADCCGEMMSGLADAKESGSEFSEMMSEMMASCFGPTGKRGKDKENL